MKKQLFIAFICAFLVHFSSSAQRFKYDFSEVTGRSSPNQNAVAVDDGWLVMQKTFSKRLYSQEVIVEIVRYNKKMEKINTVVIPLKEDKLVHLKGLYRIKGEYNLVYGYKQDKADDEVIISGIRLNPKDLSVKGEVILGSVRTATITGVQALIGAVRFNGASFAVNYSMDSSKFYLLTYPEQKKKDAKQFAFAVFNADLSKVYSKNIELDVQSRYAEIESTTLDKDGNFYVQRRTIPEEVTTSHIDKEHQKYAPEESILTQYSKDDLAGKDILLGLTGKFVYQTKITLNKATNKLDIAGTYKNMEKGKISGVFYCHYDPQTKKSAGLVSSEIPGDIADLLMKEKLAKTTGKDPGLSLAFTINNLGYRPNGSVDCMLEYENAQEQSTSGLGGSRIYYTKFYSNSILNVNIGTDGKMIFTRIPKRQEDIRDNSYLSFFSFYSGNNLVLLYNDDKKNLEKKITQMPDDIEPHKRGTVLVAAIVDEKGNLKREVVYEHQDDKYVTIPTSSRMISSNDILLKKVKLGKTFDWESTKIGVLHVL